MFKNSDSRDKRKHFIKTLQRFISGADFMGIELDREEYKKDVEALKEDAEAIKKDWERVGKDFPIR